MLRDIYCGATRALALRPERRGQGQLRRKQIRNFSRRLPPARPHLLSYWSAVLFDDLRLLGISGIHQETRYHGDAEATG